MSELSLERDDIERYVSEVADELAGSGVQRVVIIVGGALLAMHGLRAATRDVDSVKRLDEELTAAIARVASRHGLAPRWLNDSALPFLPATFDEDACETILERQSLLVLGAPLDQVFLMKLNASRAADTDDLRALWPFCSFGSPKVAAEAFYAAYPLEEYDPFLARHIEAIVCRI